MSHPFPSDFGLDNLHTALFADDPAMFHPLVFTAVTLIVLGGSKDLGTKQPLPLRFKCSVIDRFGFFDLPVGPLPNLLRRCQGDLDGSKPSRICRFGKKIVYRVQNLLLIFALR